MKKALKYGFVGYGLNALSLRAELENHPKLQGRTKLLAIFDPNPTNNRVTKEENSVKVVDTFENLLDISDLEAVIITSPPQFHADQGVTALESGLHVYSEIPMAIKKNDIEKLISAEENSGKIYQLGENYCYIPEILYAGHLSSTKRIGPIVYAESEYLHDVTYRWREGYTGDIDTPRINSWYQLFDPLMYAHSIGPAQVAMGGIKNPIPFVEVVSYSNDIGGFQGKPICNPAKAFQVALFKTETEAIAKCANAYIFAREPTRLIIQIVGRTGTYECYQLGTPGRLFLADGHKVTRNRHRKGKSEKVGNSILSAIIPPLKSQNFGALIRILDNWLTSVDTNKKSALSTKIAANFCHAGIAASESARSGGMRKKIKIYSE
ncbi:MAG: Gfo/Idh/MocA family protein [Promethearchaeota archaeon]|jgi:predicted dehydrogenase